MHQCINASMHQCINASMHTRKKLLPQFEEFRERSASKRHRPAAQKLREDPVGMSIARSDAEAFRRNAQTLKTTAYHPRKGDRS
jgi:hypothetical protein